MDIKFDVNEVLTELANGLGIAVEKVYPVLYKQAILEGVYYSVSLLCAIAIWYFVYRVSKGSVRAAKKDYGENGNGWSDDWIEHIFYNRMFHGGAGVVFCIFVAVFGIASLFMIPEMIREITTAFFNTDYYIINDLLDKVME